MSRSQKIFLSIGVILSICAAGFFWWQAEQTKRFFASHLPELPEMADKHPELRASVKQAHENILNGKQAVSNLSNLAQLYHANGYLSEAIEAYGLLTRAAPSDPRWHHLLADIQAGFGLLDEAVQHWQKASALDSEYLPVVIKMGEALEKKGDFDAARQAFERALNLHRTNNYAKTGLARIELELGDAMAAKSLLLQVTQSEPDFKPAWRLLQRVYQALGDEEKAMDAMDKGEGALAQLADPWLEKTLDYCYDSYRLTVEAAVKTDVGLRKEAMPLLLRAVEVAPDDGFAHRQLGKLYHELRDINQAFHHLEKATTLDREDPDSWIALIEVYRFTNDNKAADDALTKGLNYNPDSPSLNLMRARERMKQRQNQEAKAYLEKVIRLAPQNVSAYIDLAGVHFRLGDLASAQKSLEDALQAEPNHPMATVIYARYAIGEFPKDQAIQHVQAALANRRVSTKEKTELKQIFETKYGHQP